MAEIWTYVLAACGGISCVAAAVNWIVKGYKAAKAPDNKQNERLAWLEKKCAEHDEFLLRDKKRVDALEEGQHVTQRALLALLSHALDGNQVEDMKEAKNELQRYLINR